jgi:hypothetical protein
LRSAALQEVEALLHEAQTRTQALTDAAHERAAAIVREADTLKGQRQQEAEVLVQATLAACGEWLTTVDPHQPRQRNGADPTKLSGSVTNGALATADERPVG